MKLKTKIGCSTGTVEIRENRQRKVPYYVSGVITHEGDVGVNGHYVCTHFVEDEKKWLTIDNHEVLNKDLKYIKETNEQGTIFILRKKESNTTKISPKVANDPLTAASTSSEDRDVPDTRNTLQPDTNDNEVTKTNTEKANTEGVQLREAANAAKSKKDTDPLGGIEKAKNDATQPPEISLEEVELKSFQFYNAKYRHLSNNNNITNTVPELAPEESDEPVRIVIPEPSQTPVSQVSSEDTETSVPPLAPTIPVDACQSPDLPSPVTKSDYKQFPPLTKSIQIVITPPQIISKSTPQPDYNSDIGPNKRKLCWYYANSTCRYGDRCNNIHEKQVFKTVTYSRSRTTLKSTSTGNFNKRYYVDRDEPNEEYRKYCRWHKRGDCIHGVNCWFVEGYNQYNDQTEPERQPFPNEAQQD